MLARMELSQPKQRLAVATFAARLHVLMSTHTPETFGPAADQALDAFRDLLTAVGVPPRVDVASLVAAALANKARDEQ